MNLHAPQRMTKEAFLDWIGEQEGRYEYAGGRAIMMVRVTWGHAMVTSNLLAALKAGLDRDRYDAVSESFAVNIGASVRFPDVVVQRVPIDLKSLEAKTPIVIAEVLSPGTMHVDFSDKRKEYLNLPTLDAYLILSPDEPQVWLWQRLQGDFPLEPEILEGTNARVALAALRVEIPLADIYRGVAR
jgi:Uma2 family endonuclease